MGSVAGALLFGAHVVGVQRDFMITMFGNGSAVDASHGRYNVLLMGGDSGAELMGVIQLINNLAGQPFSSGNGVIYLR